MTTETEEDKKAREQQNAKVVNLMEELESSVKKMNQSAIARGRVEGIVYTLGGLALTGLALLAWNKRPK